jgi:hypothetical protein
MITETVESGDEDVPVEDVVDESEEGMLRMKQQKMK